MSYSQILRRLNRLIQSTITDALDNLSKADKDELDDFDRELRGEARTSGPSASGSSSTGQHSQGGQSRHSGQSRQGHASQERADGGAAAHKEGRRKPGERDDSHYYSVLGLAPSATEAEIKKAYRKLMSQYHPDRVATLGEDLQKAAADKAKTINEAYMIIERRRGFK
ncbi:MAG: DnaJ domain-containing protein [Bacteroidetes bacterium]|nr:DnaJ domain-containing protein [Bacteroidota bacterium]